MVSLNSWSVSVALYYVSVSGHSLTGELHFKNECPLIERKCECALRIQAIE